MEEVVMDAVIELVRQELSGGPDIRHREWEVKVGTLTIFAHAAWEAVHVAEPYVEAGVDVQITSKLVGV